MSGHCAECGETACSGDCRKIMPEPGAVLALAFWHAARGDTSMLERIDGQLKEWREKNKPRPDLTGGIKRRTEICGKCKGHGVVMLEGDGHDPGRE